MDSQLRTEQPEFVLKTFKRLRDQGMEEHNALHAIIAVYADILFACFRQGKPFDILLPFRPRMEEGPELNNSTALLRLIFFELTNDKVKDSNVSSPKLPDLD